MDNKHFDIKNGVLLKYLEEENVVRIPMGVTKIASDAFGRSFRSKIVQVILPESLTDIAKGAFNSFSNLKKIVIPPGLTELHSESFSGCSSLASIVLPDSLKSIGSKAFSGCSVLQNLSLPEGITQIGEGAFARCAALRDLVLPKSLKNIGARAFSGCSSLRNICLPNRVTRIAEELFSNCKNLQTLSLPEGVTSIGARAFSGCRSLNSISLPDRIIRIAEELFLNCEKLQTLSLPEGATSVGARAFSGCRNLCSISLPDSVTRIGEGAFSNCESLKSLTLPAHLTMINDQVFSECKSLQSLFMPDSITSIGAQAFFGCINLEFLKIPDTVKEFGLKAFQGCGKLADQQGFIILLNTLYLYQGDDEQVSVPETVTRINAFGTDGKAKHVRLPDNLQTIDESAFSACASLETINVPKGVSKIPDAAFRDCPQLRIVELSEGLESIGDRAFHTCISLESIDLPSSIRMIGNDAFIGCRQLKSLSLPEGMKRLGIRVFNGCSMLRDIRFPGSLQKLELTLNHGMPSLTSIHIPDGIRQIRNDMLDSCDKLTDGYISDKISLGSLSVKSRQVAASVYCNSADAHSPKRREEYESYIKKNRKKMLISALEMGHFSVAAYVLNLAGSPIKELKELIEAALKDQKTEVAAFLIEYQQNRYDTKVLERHADVEMAKGLEFRPPQALGYDKEWVLMRNRNGIHVIKNRDGSETEVSIQQLQSWLKAGESLHICFWQLMQQSTERDLAYIAIHQVAKAWRQKLEKLITAQNARAVLGHLHDIISSNKRLAVKQSQGVVDFVSRFFRLLAEEDLNKTYQLLEKKGGKSALSVWQKNPALPDMSSSGPVVAHPIEQLVQENFRISSLTKKLQKAVKRGVVYKDSNLVCSPNVLIYIIKKTYEMVPTSAYIGYEGHEKVWNNSFLKNVQKMRNEMVLEPVIASLDQNALRDCLQDLTEKDKLPYAVTAFAMICTEEQMKKLRNNSQLKYVAAGATLNKGEFAFEYSSKDSYMQLNGISKQDYLETKMTDLGFNEEGEILFDLGTSVVAAILRPDLGVDLQDRTSGKPLKSLPKDGIDKTEVSFAERTLRNLKKEIREFLAERRNVLLEDFLSGRGREERFWKAAYLLNPTLRTLGSLVVWQQGENTFTISGKGVIDSSGNPYVLQGLEIKVAHPVKMQQEEVRGWQDYFVANKLKQPFDQVWEPVIHADSVESGRYAGSVVKFNLFVNKPEHGIWLPSYPGLYLYDRTPPRRISMSALSINISFNQAIDQYKISDLKITLGTLEYESRYKSNEWNHQISLLDKWTSAAKVQEDNTSVALVLDGFTAAQINHLIRVARRSRAEKCLALLTEHLNKAHPGFKPGEKLTLED